MTKGILASFCVMVVLFLVSAVNGIVTHVLHKGC